MVLKYIIIGNYELQAKPNFNCNIINIYQYGSNTIQFSNGDEIKFNLPYIRLSGLVMGILYNVIKIFWR